jgi:hypothetical protein
MPAAGGGTGGGPGVAGSRGASDAGMPFDAAGAGVFQGDGGKGGGNFKLRSYTGELFQVGFGGLGTAVNYSNNGASSTPQQGGPGCGGGGRGAADISVNAIPAHGGAGFVYVVWGYGGNIFA